MFLSETLDFALPLALLRTRESALLALRPALRARGLSEAAFRLLRALTLAGTPITQAEAARRAGLDPSTIRGLVTGLEGYVARARGPDDTRPPRLAVSSWGARQVNHIARAAAKHGPPDWAALADRPEAGRFSEKARAALWPLLVKVQRAAEGEAVLEHANTPTDSGDDLLLGLPLQLHKTRHALLTRIRTPLSAHGLTEVQWRVLRLLALDPRAGWLRAGLCARGCFKFYAGSVLRALVILKRRGLVQARGPDTPRWDLKNRRRRLAQISRDGVAKVAEVERAIAADCADLFTRLDAEEMKLLGWLLGRLTLALLWDPTLHKLGKPQADHPFAEQYERLGVRRIAQKTRAQKRTHVRRNRLYERGVLQRPRPLTRWHEAT